MDRGRRDPNGLKAALPRMVAEVLSPTTRDFDAFEKLAEYQRVASLRYILVVEPNAPEVVLWSRGADEAWTRRVVEGIGREVAMPEIGVVLSLSELYDGVEFPVRPRLVGRDEAGG